MHSLSHWVTEADIKKPYLHNKTCTLSWQISRKIWKAATSWICLAIRNQNMKYGSFGILKHTKARTMFTWFVITSYFWRSPLVSRCFSLSSRLSKVSFLASFHCNMIHCTVACCIWETEGECLDRILVSKSWDDEIISHRSYGLSKCMW